MPIIFPDVETVIVAHLVTQFADFEGDYGAVRVGTIKTPPGEPQPEREVVVTANLTDTSQDMIRNGSAVLDVYAESYAESSSLAYLTAALICAIPGSPIKRAVVTLGPIRDMDEGPFEKRSLYVDLTVKGSEL